MCGGGSGRGDVSERGKRSEDGIGSSTDAHEFVSPGVVVVPHVVLAAGMPRGLHVLWDVPVAAI